MPQGVNGDQPVTPPGLNEPRDKEAQPNAVRVLLGALARERVLSKLFPPPVCRAQDVNHETGRGAPSAPARVPRAGPLLSVAPRVRHPPPATPRVLRHGARPALPALLPRRAADDAAHQASLRRLRLPARRAGTALRRRIPGVEAHRRDARAVLGDARGLGRSLRRAVLLPRDALVAVGTVAAAVGDGSDPRGHRQLVRSQVWLPQL